MIRVLHITDSMNIGGQETLIMNLYRHMDLERVQFDFIEYSQAKSAYDDEIEILGGKIHRIPNKRASLYKSLADVREIVKSNNYRIVHRHCSLSTMSLDLLAASLGGAKQRLAHSHSNFNNRKKLHYLFRPLLNLISTDRFACSEEAGRWMYGKKDFQRIFNGIDTDLYLPSMEKRNEFRKQKGLGDSFTICHVGRMTEEKNHLFLLRVFKEIKQVERSAQLLLVGDGELREKVVRGINSLNLDDSIVLLGVRRDVPDILQAADVFVFPSIFEGFGIALLEAEAAGLPCIMSDSVTEKLLLVPNTMRLPLEAGEKAWANAVLSMRGYARADNTQILKEAGYDIGSIARKLQEFYVQAFKSVK